MHACSKHKSRVQVKLLFPRRSEVVEMYSRLQIYVEQLDEQNNMVRKICVMTVVVVTVIIYHFIYVSENI